MASQVNTKAQNGQSKSQTAQQPQGQSFHQAVTAPVLGEIATGIMSTPAKTTGKPAAGPAIGATSKAVASSTEHASREVEIEAKLPLIDAINALGGAKVLLEATDLGLVVSKFPKGNAKTPSNENRFVQGLQGRVAEAITKAVPNPQTRASIPIKLSKGDLFRIRWDFVPGEAGTEEASRTKSAFLSKDPVVGKGLHINAEFGIGAGNACKNKIVFMPAGVGPVVDQPIARNPDRFDQIVRDQSTFLGYDIKPNTLTKVFTVEERLHPSTSPYTAPKAGTPSLESATQKAGAEEPAKAATGPASSKPASAGATTAEAGRKPTPEELKKITGQAARKLAERWAAMVQDGKEPELTEPIKAKGTEAATLRRPLTENTPAADSWQDPLTNGAGGPKGTQAAVKGAQAGTSAQGVRASTSAASGAGVKRVSKSR